MEINKKALVKKLCICCGEKGKKANKEHIFPQWLFHKTNTFSIPIRGTAGPKKIPGKHCVIPICEECNSELGKKLEEPVLKIFTQLESSCGFNDYEAELLIRWMWKITGMFYWIERAEREEDYGFVSLKNKCLNPIEPPRDRISIAISLIENEWSDKYADTPMGIDVVPELSNVLAAGVFNKAAIIVYFTKFEYLIPDTYTKYRLSKIPLVLNPNKRIQPVIGFKNGDEAIVNTAKIANGSLLTFHEKEAEEQIIQSLKAIRDKDPALPTGFEEYFSKVISSKKKY